MKNTLILVALLITLITISAKASWMPCPYDPTLTCTAWTWSTETKTITIPATPLCIATISYEVLTRTCTDSQNNLSEEFYITYINYMNQPCLDNYLIQGGYFNADHYSEILNILAEIQASNLANTFFSNPSNQTKYACNPNCLAGPTVLKITYSFPYCYGVCKAIDAGITYYMYTSCSVNHCCVHYNKYCWDTANSQIQLCEGVNTEVDFGNDQPCNTYVPVCVPHIVTHLETLTWILQTPNCVHNCD